MKDFDLDLEIAKSKERIKMLKKQKIKEIEDKLLRPRIEVYGLVGPSGDRDFGTHKVVWHARIIYSNGNEEAITDWMKGPYGYTQKRYAFDDARSKQRVCGFEIVDRGDLTELYNS